MHTKLVVLVLSTLALCWFAHKVKPQEQQNEQAVKNKKFYQGRSKLGEGSNGVVLTAAVHVVSKEREADQIQIGWTIKYKGPRPPLTILRPTLSDQTIAIFYAEGKDGKPYEYRLKGGPLITGPFPALVPKSMFLTLGENKSASGSFVIPASKLAGYYRGHWPKQFPGTPKYVDLQLLHKPRERGAHLNLDAWTGEVHSNVIRVRLKAWTTAAKKPFQDSD